MKDFFGKELNIGDEVAIMLVGYRQFVKGTIVSFTEKQVKVSHQREYYGKITTTRFPDVLIKNEK